MLTESEKMQERRLLEYVRKIIKIGPGFQLPGFCGDPDIRNIAIYDHFHKFVAVDDPSTEMWIQNIKCFMAENEPHWTIEGLYYDHGSERNAYERMIEDCRNGKIDLIIVKSVSRFSRNIIDLIEKVRLFNELGVGVYFCAENVYSLDKLSEENARMVEKLIQIEKERELQQNFHGLLRFVDGTIVTNTALVEVEYNYDRKERP